MKKNIQKFILSFFLGLLFIIPINSFADNINNLSSQETSTITLEPGCSLEAEYIETPETIKINEITEDTINEVFMVEVAGSLNESDIKKMNSEKKQNYTDLVLDPNFAVDIKTQFIDLVVESPKNQSDISTGLYSSALCGAVKTSKALSDDYLQELCVIATHNYPDVQPEILHALVFEESRNDPSQYCGSCVGLCGINKYVHADRAKKLGITNFYDPLSNLTLAADYLEDLYQMNHSMEYALIYYNNTVENAKKICANSKSTYYSRIILKNSEKIKNHYVLLQTSL